jgi:hypothetical protein
MGYKYLYQISLKLKYTTEIKDFCVQLHILSDMLFKVIEKSAFYSLSTAAYHRS